VAGLPPIPTPEPEWPVWHCPDLGEPYLMGISFEPTELVAVRLAYGNPAERRQAIIESRQTPISPRIVYWWTRNLASVRSVEDLDDVFGAGPKNFDVVWDDEDSVTATAAGVPVVGTRYLLGSCTATVFNNLALSTCAIILRRDCGDGADSNTLVTLGDLSAAVGRRQLLIEQMRGGT
jgi:hypothetical protein